MYFSIITSIHSDSIELIALPARHHGVCEEQIAVDCQTETTSPACKQRGTDFDSDSFNNAWLNEMLDFDRF